MIAVIFEAIPNEAQKNRYFTIAAALRAELEKIPGFISVERFQSLSNPEKLLSLSFWENEESVQQWRNIEMHRQAQASGRSNIFRDYHLRIAHVLRDYGMFNRTEAPVDSRELHDKKGE